MTAVKHEYFYWLCDFVLSPRNQVYRRLLQFLFEKDFRWSIPLDEDRAKDGKGLRDRFLYEMGYPKERAKELDGPCSVLEMMAAMSLRAEENIMADPELGDRTPYWFWCMIKNLGLYNQNDYVFDIHYVDSTVENFLCRRYFPNGKGGLFTVENPRRDMRNVELWYQMMWYLCDVINHKEEKVL